MVRAAAGAVVLSILAIAPAAAQRVCPDLSGRYVVQGEDGQVVTTIVQRGCAHVSITRRTNYLDRVRESVTHDLDLDGRWRDDADWFDARRPALTSARFRGDTLAFAERAPAADSAAVAWRYDFVRLTNGDLCSRFTRRGATSAARAARVSGASAAALDSAARRSGPRC